MFGGKGFSFGKSAIDVGVVVKDRDNLMTIGGL